MIKEKEVNYKLLRSRKERYCESYLVIDGNDYYWTDDYDRADLFSSINMLNKIVKEYNVDFDYPNHYYYVVEDIVSDMMPYEGGR
jgi:hypothetical protein